jgi:predicted Ser/Thr protein kinase
VDIRKPLTMSLSAGDRLGPYEILAPIGEGGMGAVWKARDTRLNRTVAVKVSREKFSDRFEREARAVAALNHHHICTLHDVGPNYLVMEFVEGTPLKGPLPAEKALEYARQICDALDAAHRKGITHRDLKPGNVLVTKQGIKLLDFGIAKVAGDETLTATGAVMGTPAYMAPEQWAGQPGDARSDIYSLGCVLYEMLTGRRSSQERNPVEPAALEKIIGRCLAKDPEERWQSARDVKAGLDLVALGQAPFPASARSGGPWAWLAAGALAIVPGLALWAPWRVRVTSHPQVPWSVDLNLGPAGARYNIGPDVILSPDGTRIVYVAQATNGVSRLLTRPLESEQAGELSGTEGAFSPFFSPDGKWLAFFVRGALKKTRVEGGQPVSLCEAPWGRGGSWGDDGTTEGIIVAALDSNVGLVRVPTEGGIPEPLTTLGPGENSHSLAAGASRREDGGIDLEPTLCVLRGSQHQRTIARG